MAILDLGRNLDVHVVDAHRVFRHHAQALRGVDHRAHEALREIAVLHMEDGLLIVRRLARLLLTQQAPIERLIQDRGQFRVASHDFIVHRDGAGKHQARYVASFAQTFKQQTSAVQVRAHAQVKVLFTLARYRRCQMEDAIKTLGKQTFALLEKSNWQI